MTTYIHKEGTYPEDAVSVHEVVDGVVKFFPMGGGFGHSAPEADFYNDFRKYDPAIDKDTLRRGYFSLDDEPVLPGYHTGHNWNGWAMPSFEFKEAQAIADMFPGSDMPITYDKDQDAFIVLNSYSEVDPDEEIYPGKDILINGQKIHVYAIGDGWCWNLDDETEYNRDQQARKGDA